MISRPGCRKEPGYVIASYVTANHHAPFPLHRNSVSGSLETRLGGGGLRVTSGCCEEGSNDRSCF